MTEDSPLRSCPGCGATPGHRERSCPFCGTALPRDGNDSARDSACAAFLLAMDKDLSELTSPRMLVGFVLFFAAIPAAYLATRWLGAGVIEAVAVTVLIGLGAAVGLGMLVSTEEDRRFRNVLRPQIEAFLAEHQMHREELLATAKSTLKESSVLLKHLDDLYATSPSSVALRS